MATVTHIRSEDRIPSVRVAESDIETPLCPLCHSSSASIIHIFDPFKVASCRKCGMIYLNPRLKESVIGSLYREEAYFSRCEDTGYEDYSFQEKSLRMTFRRFLNELKRHRMTSGRLLEIGCGYGYFLEEAKSFFSSLAGTELSEKAGTLAKQKTGADIFIGTVDSLPPHFKDFDIIVLINVIEHIYAPVNFLSDIKKRLNSSGTIIIATPDIGSFWYRIMKKNWPSFKIPEHVAFYAEKTLKSLLERSGFQHMNRISFPHAFPFGLITSKFGLKAPGAIRHKTVWIPKTMIAFSAEVI